MNYTISGNSRCWHSKTQRKRSWAGAKKAKFWLSIRALHLSGCPSFVRIAGICFDLCHLWFGYCLFLQLWPSQLILWLQSSFTKTLKTRYNMFNTKWLCLRHMVPPTKLCVIIVGSQVEPYYWQSFPRWPFPQKHCILDWACCLPMVWAMDMW